MLVLLRCQEKMSDEKKLPESRYFYDNEQLGGPVKLYSWTEGRPTIQHIADLSALLYRGEYHMSITFKMGVFASDLNDMYEFVKKNERDIFDTIFPEGISRINQNFGGQ